MSLKLRFFRTFKENRAKAVVTQPASFASTAVSGSLHYPECPSTTLRERGRLLLTSTPRGLSRIQTTHSCKHTKLEPDGRHHFSHFTVHSSAPHKFRNF